MLFRKRSFSQLHVTDNEKCAVAFYPSILSVSLNRETTLAVACQFLNDQRVLGGSLTTLIRMFCTGRMRVFNLTPRPL
jgi:hypothetical protein